jgi:hypothetical protein
MKNSMCLPNIWHFRIWAPKLFRTFQK